MTECVLGSMKDSRDGAKSADSNKEEGYQIKKKAFQNTQVPWFLNPSQAVEASLEITDNKTLALARQARHVPPRSARRISSGQQMSWWRAKDEFSLVSHKFSLPGDEPRLGDPLLRLSCSPREVSHGRIEYAASKWGFGHITPFLQQPHLSRLLGPKKASRDL